MKVVLITLGVLLSAANVAAVDMVSNNCLIGFV